jgi:polyferredoxin
VDAVSMATLTSSAIARSIRGRLAMLAGSPLTDERAPAPGWSLEAIRGLDGAILALIAWAILLTWRIGPFRHPRVHRVARVGLSIASVGLLGWVGATMFSMALIEGWALAGRVHGGTGIVLLAGVVLAFPLLTGRNVYCQGLCPFGAAQELLWKISPRRRHLPHAVSHRLRRVRDVLLLAVVLSMIAGRGLSPEWQEPFSAFRWAAAGWPARLLAGLALALSLVGFHRPWCSYFCSSGALLDWIRKTRKLERKTP